MTTKTVQTKVTSAELVAAQGGVGGGDDLLWVECPDHYDVARIDAGAIANDGQIRMLKRAEVEALEEAQD